MGVVATLFVLATYSDPDEGFVRHVFRLRAGKALWDPLHALAYHQVYADVQLPHGGHSNFGKDAPPIPAEFADHEAGHLQRDPYGQPLRAIKGSQLLVLDDGGTFNQAVFEFIATHFPEHDIVVYWS